MNFALTSHVLMSHWVPGFLVVMAIRAEASKSTSQFLKSLIGIGSGEANAILIIAVTAFVVGEFLDAFRDTVLEDIWDKFQPLAWGFFRGGKDEVENFKASYFTYYVFDTNASQALVILILVTLVQFIFTPSYGMAALLAVLVLFIGVFAWNARRLRREMVDVMKGTRE